MPPRPRKTAATKPAAPESDVERADSETLPSEPEPSGETQPAPEPEPTPEPTVEQEPEAEADTPDDDPAEDSPTAGTPEPVATAFHWETPAGAPGDPCRLCLPAGPPATAGSIGCQHGQWVRVWDGGQ